MPYRQISRFASAGQVGPASTPETCWDIWPRRPIQCDLGGFNFRQVSGEARIFVRKAITEIGLHYFTLSRDGLDISCAGKLLFTPLSK
jgi:hypothetical protein